MRVKYLSRSLFQPGKGVGMGYLFPGCSHAEAATVHEFLVPVISLTVVEVWHGRLILTDLWV